MNPPFLRTNNSLLNDLYHMMKKEDPSLSFQDIISKMGDKILYDFMYF